MVRLGAGGLDGGRLSEQAMSATVEVLSRYRRLADSHGVDEILAAATSATREAENGGEFLKRVEREVGLRVHVISALDEARLIHLAAAYGTDIGRRRAVVIEQRDVIDALRMTAPAADEGPVPLREARSRFERQYILYRLSANQGSLGRTARDLGIERTNLYRKMRQLGIQSAPGRQRD